MTTRSRQHELALLDLKDLMMECYKKHITMIILNQAQKAKLVALEYEVGTHGWK